MTVTAMTFLGCVNRILRLNGLIRGDTDLLTAFSDTSHNSSSQLAQIAVQDELTDLCSRGLLPNQRTEAATIALVTSTRTYSLPDLFVQMWTEDPFFYDAVQNNRIVQYPGGEEQLRLDIRTYRTDVGNPRWFYFPQGTTRKVGFYPVPDASANGKSLLYDYEASVNVTDASHNIPVNTVDQQYAFTSCAARRFKFLFEGKTDVALKDDSVYQDARTRLFQLLRSAPASTRYGKRYF